MCEISEYMGNIHVLVNRSWVKYSINQNAHFGNLETLE